MSEITLLTIGYPGNGKSTTANTILGYDAFAKNNSTAKIVTVPSVRTSADKTITVVDGLCLMELDEDTLFDSQTAVQICDLGINAVLVVLRFGEKFSEEEAKLVEVARKVFGPNILRDFGVCLVTHGDDFKYAVEEGEEDSKTLDAWCRKQKGKLHALLSECGNRCVMFDNRKKDPKEKVRLLSIVRNLSKRYTLENFHKLHGRTFVMSHNKQLQMIFRQRLEGVRGKLKSNPSASDFEHMLKELRDISEEATRAFQNKEHIQTVIHEAQVLTKSIKSLQEKFFRLSGSDQIVDSQTKTRASGQATVQDFSALTFETQLFRHEAQKKDDSEKVYNDLLEKNVRELDTNHRQPALATQSARSKHQVNADDEPKEKSIQPLDDISILIVGRSGNGKSSTGNSILGGREFQINSTTTSTNSSVQSQRKKMENLSVCVVDGPSLDHVALNASTNLAEMMGTFKEALQQCDYRFNGVVVVLKFGQRFTKQEKDAIVMIKSILGKDVLRKYGVCVMTYGDNFDNEMEESDVLEFIDWCKQQTGEIADVFEECSYRCVLFDNKTQDEEKLSDQRKTLFRFINTNLRYSEAEFLEAEKDFQDLSLQCAMPLLEQATTTNLAKVRDKLQEIELEFPRNDEKYKKELERMKEALQQYRMNLEALGQNSSIDYLIQLVTTVELQINSKLKLCQQTKELKRLDSETHQLRQNVAFTTVSLGDSESVGPASSLYPGNLLSRSTKQEETLTYIENLRQFLLNAYRLCNSAKTADPTYRINQKQELVDDIEVRLREAASRGERNETLDELLAHLTEMKGTLCYQINIDKGSVQSRNFDHPLATVSVDNDFQLVYPYDEHTPVVNTKYPYPTHTFQVSHSSTSHDLQLPNSGRPVKSSCVSGNFISKNFQKLSKSVKSKWKKMEHFLEQLFQTSDPFR